MFLKCMLLLGTLVYNMCASERVLVVFPMPGRSHTTLGDAVVRSLLKGGHDVTYITTATQLTNDRLTVINVTPDGDQYDPDGEVLNVDELLQSSISSQHEMTTGTKYVVRALRHEHVQLLMRNKLVSFDVVVAEWFYSRLLAPYLSHVGIAPTTLDTAILVKRADADADILSATPSLGEVFQCPLVWYSPVDAFWMNLQLVHESPNPAYAVDLQAKVASEIPDVKERALRIWRQMYMTAWQYYFVYYVEGPLYYELYQLAIQRRGRTPPLYEELIHSGALLLINSQPILGQNLPLPNSAKYIGGHHLGTSEPLTKELQDILTRSKYGVIYVNFGASISRGIPQKTVQLLLKMFTQLEQDIIWKYSEKLDYVPANVHLVDWVPQQAVLRHPNTTMMISHAGYLSYIEAMYYGVPIVGIPVAGDQLLSMEHAAARGRGIKVHYSDKLASTLRAAVNEIFANYSYRSSAMEASSMLRKRLVPPSQELRHWVELVMSTGGARLLRSPAISLNIMERYHLDVIVLVCLMYWFLTKVVKLVKVYWNDYGTDCDTEKQKSQ